MSKKEIFQTKNLVRLALVAALYAALTLAIPGLSFGSIQFRFSEILVLLWRTGTGKWANNVVSDIE